MSRVVRYCLALFAVLALAGPSLAQTDKPCNIAFENLSRETLTISHVSVLQADDSSKEISGYWTYAPGQWSYMSVAGTSVAGKAGIIVLGKLENIQGRECH